MMAAQVSAHKNSCGGTYHPPVHLKKISFLYYKNGCDSSGVKGEEIKKIFFLLKTASCG